MKIWCQTVWPKNFRGKAEQWDGYRWLWKAPASSWDYRGPYACVEISACPGLRYLQGKSEKVLNSHPLPDLRSLYKYKKWRLVWRDELPTWALIFCSPGGPSTFLAAKSLQSCPTLCNPIDGSPPGSPVPGILQARTLEWVAISFSNVWKWKVKVKSLRLSTWKLHSRVRLLATPWTAVYQAPQSMGFSRQEYWSGVPLCSSSFRLSKNTGIFQGWFFISIFYILSMGLFSLSDYNTLYTLVLLCFVAQLCPILCNPMDYM